MPVLYPVQSLRLLSCYCSKGKLFPYPWIGLQQSQWITSDHDVELGRNELQEAPLCCPEKWHGSALWHFHDKPELVQGTCTSLGGG